MQFIHDLPSGTVEDLLNTKEKVAALRESLIEATEESLEKLARAKVASWQGSHEIVVD